ncbi:aminotransferase class IV [uncultured Jatrophihabitans sp.]|uniref:aminotransferase class IV n=1 Tax=uncultured Jatrophihabitans sp. TaxID=1610747 RepID=UPI0035CC3FE4
MPDPSSAVLAVLGAGLVDPASPVARADDAGLTRGDGCFEGCRIVMDADGRATVAKLDAHLARMTRSAAALDIGFDAEAWRDLVAVAVAEWTRTGGGEAAMKLLLSRGPASTGEPTGLAWIVPVTAETVALRQNGLKVITLTRGLGSDAFAQSPWLLGGVKTLSYAINMAAQREAERLGADDVIFVSADGIVLEAPTGTVVWSHGRTLHTTPTGDTGILPGTTQQLMFEHAGAAGWQVRETTATVDELHAADVVWVISSVRGPVDVVELDGKSRERRPDIDAEIRRLSGF